ncbi:MAG: bifunctional demethylmenaquinone methyltransferase/2-methoxy-6-polyprenyl-1,4-benzoquinol methylase UbiE [Muribaculaceae bacterium]|nr:bifunctional demethylmenaquinone methyltransferase/2-methoxy-6-polyprenyl-1,4-benzoquinol methylase UbiE [Muribaculaceae bacterium]
MFDSIAPAYDFMNRAMTLGIDRWWRRVAVRHAKRHLASSPPHRDAAAQVLDVATGTGDFAILLHQSLPPCQVTGIDLSQGMLEVAQRKVAQRQLQNTIHFMQGDCLAMPFEGNAFDAVTVAFGVRNFEHIDQGYREMLRVLRPGGLVCVVELSTPRNKLIRWFYDLYTLRIIPAMGALKSGDSSAYRYLPLSIAAVPQGEEMLELMQAAGFEHCQQQRLTLGTCTIYTGVKPQ